MKIISRLRKGTSTAVGALVIAVGANEGNILFILSGAFLIITALYDGDQP